LDGHGQMGHRGEARYAGVAKHRPGERYIATSAGGALRSEGSRGEAGDAGLRPDRGQGRAEDDEERGRVVIAELYPFPFGDAARAKRHDGRLRALAAGQRSRPAGGRRDGPDGEVGFRAAVDTG